MIINLAILINKCFLNLMLGEGSFSAIKLADLMVLALLSVAEAELCLPWFGLLCLMF